MSQQSPPYYVTTHGQETYEVLKQFFGVETLRQHLAIEGIQHLLAIRDCGGDSDNVRAVMRACYRLLDLIEKESV